MSDKDVHESALPVPVPVAPHDPFWKEVFLASITGLASSQALVDVEGSVDIAARAADYAMLLLQQRNEARSPSVGDARPPQIYRPTPEAIGAIKRHK